MIVDTKDNIENVGDAKGTDSGKETTEDPHAGVEVSHVPHLLRAWHGDIPVLHRDGIYSGASSRQGGIIFLASCEPR